MTRFLWLATACALLAGCGTDAGPGRSADAAAAATQPRIVSLAPHLTELIFSAGAGEYLVGTVSFSDYPPQARAIARVGDAFRIDTERLAALAPTMIIAWEGGNPAAVLDRLVDDGYRVERFATQGLEGISHNLRRVGSLIGSPGIAQRAADDFDARLQTLRERYFSLEPVSVFFQIGEQPVFTVSDDHAIGQIIALCGGRNVFANLSGLAASVSDESVVASDPQVLMTAGNVTSLARWQRYDGRAVRAGYLFGIDADTITRDSLRILDGAAQVCAHLQSVRAGLDD